MIKKDCEWESFILSIRFRIGLSASEKRTNHIHRHRHRSPSVVFPCIVSVFVALCICVCDRFVNAKAENTSEKLGGFYFQYPWKFHILPLSRFPLYRSTPRYHSRYFMLFFPYICCLLVGSHFVLRLPHAIDLIFQFLHSTGSFSSYLLWCTVHSIYMRVWQFHEAQASQQKPKKKHSHQHSRNQWMFCF